MDQLLKYFSVSVSQWHSCPNGDGEKSQPTQVKKTYTGKIKNYTGKIKNYTGKIKKTTQVK